MEKENFLKMIILTAAINKWINKFEKKRKREGEGGKKEYRDDRREDGWSRGTARGLGWADGRWSAGLSSLRGGGGCRPAIRIAVSQKGGCWSGVVRATRGRDHNYTECGAAKPFQPLLLERWWIRVVFPGSPPHCAPTGPCRPLFTAASTCTLFENCSFQWKGGENAAAPTSSPLQILESCPLEFLVVG